MGAETHRREENEAAWDRYVKAEDIRCNVCKCHIPYRDRGVYFSMKMCGYCARKA
jgi:hypothetical protein